MRTSPDPPWYWKPWLRLPSLRDWWYRERPLRKRDIARMRAEGYWPGGYAPHELLSARHDSPDPTGPLVDFEQLAMLADMDGRGGRLHMKPRPVKLGPMDPGDVVEGR